MQMNMCQISVLHYSYQDTAGQTVPLVYQKQLLEIPLSTVLVKAHTVSQLSASPCMKCVILPSEIGLRAVLIQYFFHRIVFALEQKVIV